MVWRPVADPRHAGRLAGTVLVVASGWSGSRAASPLMWTLVVIAAAAGRRPCGLHGAVQHLFRRDGDAAPLAEVGPAGRRHPARPRACASCSIALAIALLVWGWGLDVGALAAQESPGARLAQGLLHAVVILLVADLLWKLARTAIDRQLRPVRRADGPRHARTTCRPTRRAGAHGCARSCRSCASCCSSCSPPPRS